MGRSKRQRRNHQKPRPSRGGNGRGPSAASTTGRPPSSVAEGFALLAEAFLNEHPAVADRIAPALADRWASSAGAELPQAVDQALLVGTGSAWAAGWQPAELVHAVGRKLPAPDRRLLVDLLGVEGAAWRAHPTPDEGWLQQLDDLEVAATPPPGGSAFGAWVHATQLDRIDALLRAGALLAMLWRIPRIPPVGDPPSAWGRGARAASVRRGRAGVDEAMLAKVRSLLAKAESTEFPAEAEALTEKAQELMARYSIDRALVEAASGGGAVGGGGAESRRVLIHDPYAKGKSHLLAQVADANRCQAVWSKDLGFSTVFGFGTDLTMTDLLYTSLVSQCSRAMQRTSKGVASPRTFRESFVLAFSLRIGDRLHEATAATVAEAVVEHGDALLPVLARREEDVTAARDAAFPRLRSNRMRISDSRGWAAGTAAADLATLDAGKAVGR